MKKNQACDDTVIWRYMKLSTFMLLLEGKVFVPAVSTLQCMDPREGRLGEKFFITLAKFLGDQLQDATQEQRDWFFKLVNEMPLAKLLNKPYNKDYKRDNSGMVALSVSKEQAEVYACELAKMRAAWCWFMDDNESASMWDQYGKHGVAICSTVGALKESLIRYSPRIDPILYITPQGKIAGGRRPSDDHIIRPYTMKLNSYASEKELRFSFLCADGYKGRFLDLDLGFILKIKTSPAIPNAEAKVIIEYAKVQLCKARLASLAVTSDMAAQSLPQLPFDHEKSFDDKEDVMPNFIRKL